MTKPISVRDKAIQMRTQQQASLQDISAALGIAKSTASVWLRDYPLPKTVQRERQRAGAVAGAKLRQKHAVARNLTAEQSARRAAFELLSTKRRGTVSEFEITLRFLRQGLPVLVPIGDNERYDLVVERTDGFKRIQCKTGKYLPKEGVIRFNVSSFPRSGVRQSYKGQVDFFGVYCAAFDTCYLVDVDVAGESSCHLRVKPATNSQIDNVLWADKYEI